MSTAPLVEMRRVSKSFGGVRAVADMDLTLEPGEVVGLLGHNGAGKSTLIKMLSGAIPCDSGEIQVAGQLASIRTPRDARRLGIETLYQDLALADNLDATANLFLGREILRPWGGLDEAAMERAAHDALQRLNPEFRNLSTPVGHLSGGQRQSIAIARALAFDPKVLIMDEPTAALGPAETRMVGELIGRLKQAGIGIILVSHDLHDVFDLADRITVMKNGRLVATERTEALSHDAVLGMIIAGHTG
jgi:D-xylose transport system ATP-binding protein